MESGTLLPEVDGLIKHGATKLLRSIFRSGLWLRGPHPGIVYKAVREISLRDSISLRILTR
jgi:hypothetical protein